MEPIIELQHRQITSQRDVRGSNFPSGVQDYNFTIGGNMAWIPNKSYFRIGLKITDGAGGRPVAGSRLSFADNVCSNLFTNCYFRAGGQDVSSIVNYAAQGEQTKKRLQRTGAWLSNIGKIYGMEADYTTRRDNIAVGVGDASIVYFLWQPPIGIMDVSSKMGSGDYRFQLNPNAFYKQACVEAITDDGAGGTVGAVPGTDYNFEVENIEFYAAVCRETISPSGHESLTLNEMQVQSKPVVDGENNLDFTVPVSTKYISVFMQSQKSGTDTRVPLTKFTTLPSGDENSVGTERKLKSIQLSYANTSKPSTRWQSADDQATGVAQLQQRYLDSKSASGLLYSEGGAESYEDWLKRGILLHYSFTRDRDDRSSQLQVQVNFDGLAPDTNLFVVAHYTRQVDIHVDKGFITAVSTRTI